MIGRLQASLLTGALASTMIMQASLVYAESRDRGTIGSENSITQCIHEAATGRPWLEQTLWALRRHEGGWVGAEVKNGDGSVDLGPMQVNSWWVPRIARLIGRSQPQVKSWLRDDPCFNIDAARWIFLSGLAATRDYWDAIGVYHSPTASRQHRYRNGVARQLIACGAFNHTLRAGYGSEGRDTVAQTVPPSAQALNGGIQ